MEAAHPIEVALLGIHVANALFAVMRDSPYSISDAVTRFSPSWKTLLVKSDPDFEYFT